MGKRINGQTLASTHLDAQGERTPLDVLQRLAAERVVSLCQAHDLGLAPIGHVENLRVERAPEHAGEFRLVGDVQFLADELPPEFRGFSYSLTVRRLEARKLAEIEVFVPKPYYDDQALLKGIQGEDDNVAVGAWYKKALSPDQIALLGALYFLLRPAWDQLYKSVVWPGISRVWERLRTVAPSIKSANLLFTIQGPSDCMDAVQVLLVPGDWTEEAIERDRVHVALEQAMHWTGEDWVARRKPVKLVKLMYDAREKRFKVFSVEYVDGQIVSILD